MAADINAWQGADQQIHQQVPIHRAHVEMSQASYSRQRNRVRNITADDPRRREQREQPEQRRHAERSSSDRTQSDQCADNRSRRYGRGDDMSFAPFLSRAVTTQALQPFFKEDSQRSQN